MVQIFNMYFPAIQPHPMVMAAMHLPLLPLPMLTLPHRRMHPMQRTSVVQTFRICCPMWQTADQLSFGQQWECVHQELAVAGQHRMEILLHGKATNIVWF